MGRLIEEQAVIECLTNTAKYYEREDADEWTKGIHYGLLHGLDNILDNAPTVEAYTKEYIENIKEEILEKSFSVVNPNNTYEYINVLDLGSIEKIIDKYKGESEK